MKPTLLDRLRYLSANSQGFTARRDVTPSGARALVKYIDRLSGRTMRPAGCQCTWEFGDSPCPVHDLEQAEK